MTQRGRCKGIADAEGNGETRGNRQGELKQTEGERDGQKERKRKMLMEQDISRIKY